MSAWVLWDVCPSIGFRQSLKDWRKVFERRVWRTGNCTPSEEAKTTGGFFKGYHGYEDEQDGVTPSVLFDYDKYEGGGGG